MPMVVHLSFSLWDVADGLHQPVIDEARGLSSVASCTASLLDEGQLSGVEHDRAKDRIRWRFVEAGRVLERKGLGLRRETAVAEPLVLSSGTQLVIDPNTVAYLQI